MQPEMFRKLAGHWLTGVSVVTTLDPNGVPVGMTMSAVTSLSLDPPQFLICVDNRARTLAAIVASGHFCINYLRQDQENLSTAFARAARIDSRPWPTASSIPAPPCSKEPSPLSNAR